MTPFTSNKWEVLIYIALVFVAWFILRFVATIVMTLYRNFCIEQPVVVDPFINGVKYAVSYWTERGGRPYQEDRHFEQKGLGPSDSSLYGVFDGHGGYKAAQYCKEFLLQAIIKDIEFERNPAQAIFNSFYKVDKDFSAKARVQMLTDGTTSIVAIIHDKKIFIGNAGDSRAILVQKGGKAKAMSADHRPDRKDEESRIRQLGGKVVHWGRWRVEGILAVSRAIGDVSLQPYITCEPEITEKQIDSDDEYLVLATDGLWDVLRNDEVAKLVLKHAKNNFVNISKELCSEAILMGSADNVTALVIDLKQRITPESHLAAMKQQQQLLKSTAKKSKAQ